MHLTAQQEGKKKNPKKLLRETSLREVLAQQLLTNGAVVVRLARWGVGPGPAFDACDSWIKQCLVYDHLGGRRKC